MFEQGELVLIPYPFTDLSTHKKRPVLVLSKPDQYGDFVALPVTSRGYHEHSIAIQDQIIEGELPKKSWVRTDHVVTLNKSLVIKSFAICSARLITEVMDNLCHFLNDNERRI